MADLPDLPDLKDSTQPTDLELAGAQHAADWASRFGGGDTNLAQRNKHVDDIVNYNSMVQQQHDQQLAAQIQTGKNAFNFWKATQDLKQKERLHAQDMALKAPLIKAQQDAAIARAEASHKSDMLKAQHELQAAQHLTGFADTLQEGFAQGVQPGTKAYQDLAIKALLANPHADKNVVQHVFGLAKLKADPDEVLAQWNAIPADQKAATVWESKPDGTIGFRARNITPVEQSHIDSATTNAATAQQREARLKYAAEVKAADAAGLPPPPPPQSAVATPSAPTSPKAADARPVFKDAKGNRAYKNPDGSFEPIQ